MDPSLGTLDPFLALSGHQLGTGQPEINLKSRPTTAAGAEDSQSSSSGAGPSDKEQEAKAVPECAYVSTGREAGTQGRRHDEQVHMEESSAERKHRSGHGPSGQRGYNLRPQEYMAADDGDSPRSPDSLHNRLDSR